MPENTKNDWLVASFTKPDFTLGDFEQVGLTAQNTQLLKPQEYEKNEKIQKMFVNPNDGKFDKAGFQKFYDVATQTYNDFAKKEYDTTILNDNYFFQENYHAPKDAKRFKNTVSITKVKNPFNQKQGIEGFTTKTDSGLSIREIAQTQSILDHETGKSLGFTPNETGFFGSIFKPTAVLAAWDTDGMHYDADSGRNIKHQKGDFKYNENGKNYYETLGTREVYGKESLSSWDVLTEDGTTANKWDFMDSDGLTKSLTGTIFKTTAQVLPYLIPGVGQWYTGITIGNALLTDLLPVLVKSTGGLFMGDALKDTSVYKAMNELQGYGKKFHTSISDEGKTSTFNKENIFAMAGDVFGQLAQQKLIAKVPLWLGQTGKEIEVVSKYGQKYGAEGLDDISKALKAFKGENAMAQRANYLRNKLGADDDIIGAIEKWDKWGSAGSKALGIGYMSGISATGVAEEAKAHGLDERDTAALTLGTMAGFGLFMTKFKFAHWAIEGMGLDELGGFLKQSVRAEMKPIVASINKIADATGKGLQSAATNASDNIAAEIVESGAEATKETLKTKLVSLFNKGKQIGKSVADSMGDIGTVKQKMLAESLEETSEEAMQDAIKTVYNGMRGLGLTSTDKDQSKQFKFDDMFDRYAMSALGGAIGGGISGFQDKLAGKIYDELPESLTRDFASIVRHGYGDAMQRQLDKIHKSSTGFGSKLLSITQHQSDEKLTDETNYVPMSAVTDGISHNDFVYNVLTAQLQLAQKTILQEGIDTDVRLNDIYAERAGMFMDLKANTAIVDDIDRITAAIIKEKAKIAQEEGGTKNGTKGEDATIASETSSSKKVISDLKEELNEITSGNRALQYVGEALFGVNRLLNNAFGIENKDTLAYRDYQKRYEALTNDEKADIDSKYTTYKTSSRMEQVRIAKLEFDKLKDGDFNDMVPILQKYGDQRKAFLHRFINIEDTLERLKLETEDDVNKIDNSRLSTLNMGVIGTDDISKSSLTMLADYVKAEQYLNPVMYEYVKNNYSQSFGLGDKFDLMLQDAMNNNGILADAISLGMNNLTAETGVEVASLIKNMSKFNFTETMEKLKDVVNNPGFKDLAGITIDDDGEPVDAMAYKKAFLETLESISNSLLSVAEDINGQAVYTPDVVMMNDIRDIDIIKNEYNVRPSNPLIEYLSKLTKREGRNDLANLVDILNSEFNNLAGKSAATDYIIDSKISKEQLEYGKDLIHKLSAVVEATVDYTGYTPDTEGIGFNAAMNAINAKSAVDGFEELNVMSADAAHAIHADLQLLEAKITFLLKLNEFNSNGNIRELKMTGATMSTLYLDSLSNGSDSYLALKDAGVDMSEIDTALDTAVQFKKNLIVVQSAPEEKLVLESTDQAFHLIRQERDAVEQAIFKAVNSLPNRDEVINEILDKFKIGIYTVDNQSMNFSSNTRIITRGQKLMYLAQSLTVDPKQFYKDFVGELDQGENLLATDPYAPFYGQEHVIKQMYWHMISKMSSVDTFKKVADVLLLPDRTMTEAELNNLQHHRNIVDLNKLKNATVLFGMPGAGKTTSALYYITKIAERYGMSAAVFAPEQEQGNSLKESLKDRPNVYNSNTKVSAILDTVLGSTLLDKLREDYANRNFTPYSVKDSITSVDPTSTLILKESHDGRKMVEYNPNNELVAAFLKETARVISHEGRVPQMIIIDEATHIPSVELQLLNYAIGIHNTTATKQPIALYLVGDREQRGNNITINGVLHADNITTSTLLMTTPVLSQSLRNRYNVKNKNINAVRALRSAFESVTRGDGANLATAVQLLKNGVRFEYVEDEKEGLIGEKLVKEFSKEDLKSLFESTPGRVALITNTPSESLLNLIKQIPGAFERLDIFTPNKVQGLERDNVIIDLPANDRLLPSLAEANESYSAMEMLYTMISRSKKGTLIKAPFIASIALTSTDEDVHAQKIELDKAQIDKYKEFTVEGIKQSYARLEDLGLSPTESRAQTAPKPKPSPDEDRVTPEEKDQFMEVLSTEIDNQGDGGDSITNGLGESVPLSADEVRPQSYTYHERLGFTTFNGKVGPITNPNADGAVMYKLVTKGNLIEGTKLDSKEMIEVREQTKKLKSGLLDYAYQMSINANPGNLTNFLVNRHRVHAKVINTLKLDQAVAKIQTKEFDPTVDNSNSKSLKPTANTGAPKGLISYLVLDIPRINEPNITLTISALPNTNNPNVFRIKGVMDSMTEIRKFHHSNNIDGVSEMPVETGVKWYEILTPSSNVYINHDNVSTYKEFKDKHSHLNLSTAHVIMSTDIISEDPAVVEEYFNNFNSNQKKGNRNSSSLIGKTVVFVSYDHTIPRSRLADEYRKQLNVQIKQKLAGEPVSPGTIRMVVLNKQGLSFRDWLYKNIQITKAQIDDMDVKAQRRAYANNFAGANMLASLINFKRRAEIAKEGGQGSLVDALGLPKHYSTTEAMTLIDQVDNIIKTALPMVTGQTFDQKYLDPTRNEAEALKAFVEKNALPIDEFLKTVFDGESKLKQQAIEHFIASDLLKTINASQAKAEDVRVYNDMQNKITVKLPNAALYDMVSSIRLAMVGGVIDTNDGSTVKVDGILKNAFATVEGPDMKAFNKMLDGIDAILKPRFPDGIHINSVLRTAAVGEGYSDNVTPFVVPSGNMDDAFKVNVTVQTPTILVDVSKFSAKPSAVSTKEEETKQKDAQIKAGQDLISLIEAVEVKATNVLDFTSLKASITTKFNGDLLQDLDGDYARAVKHVEERINSRIEGLHDNVITQNSVDFILRAFGPGGLITSGMKESATIFAEKRLAEDGIDHTNIVIEYTSKNRPGTTEKVREFTIRDSVTNDIIGTFAYRNKDFTKLELVQLASVDLAGIAELFKDTPLIVDFQLIEAAVNDPSLYKAGDADSEKAFRISYTRAMKYLKKEGFTEQADRVSEAYNKIIHDTKC